MQFKNIQLSALSWGGILLVVAFYGGAINDVSLQNLNFFIDRIHSYLLVFFIGASFVLAAIVSKKVKWIALRYGLLSAGLFLMVAMPFLTGLKFPGGYYSIAAQFSVFFFLYAFSAYAAEQILLKKGLVNAET